MQVIQRGWVFTIVAWVCGLAAVSAARAEVRFAGIFGDQMVLQRDCEVPVWGWATPHESVTVQFANQTLRTTADAAGKWSVRLAATPAGGPFQLSASGTSQVALRDVLVGEVWLCSGQSNMAMTVNRAKDFEAERQQAQWPLIRQFKTAAHAAPEPQPDCEGSWSICGPETVGTFSATAYFFGRKLHQELNVPIGLINSSWGGTDVAAWTSLPAQQAVPAIVPKLEQHNALITAYDPAAAKAIHDKAVAAWEKRAADAQAAGTPVPRKPRLAGDPRVDQNRPANLFNGMIHPLIPFAIRGAIWYQGERNARTVEDGLLYGTQLQTLIGDWRSRWGQGNFPFLTVQLPNFHAAVERPVQTTGWVMVRESQRRTLALPNTGLAVTTDVGEANDIHPRDKQTVGQRLALWALGASYGRDIEYSGPLMAFCQYRAGSVNRNGKLNPGRMMVSFTHADELKAADGQPLRGFAVADQDRQFHPAQAEVDAATGMLLLSSPQVRTPVAARYNWSDNPRGNLVNGAGLPAAPFRTDAWDVLAEQ